MRIIVCLYAGLLVAIPAVAESTEAFVIEMYVPPARDTPVSLAFLRAQSVVAEVYSEIGLTVRWHVPTGHVSGCSKTQLHRAILVAFSWGTPPAFHPDALAVSNPYSTGAACITLFMDRLQPMIALHPNTTGFLLGYVLSHEIGHVLQGIARHSDTGVLKASWSMKEVQTMPSVPLRFSRYDAELILESIRGHEEKVARHE